MKNQNPIETLETIEHQLAQDAAEEGQASAADREWSKQLGAKLHARLAELRRLHTPADEPIAKAKPIRATTLAMTRDALVEAINQLTRMMGGAVQYAHRNLKGLSDDDLRRLYDTLDPDADLGE